MNSIAIAVIIGLFVFLMISYGFYLKGEMAKKAGRKNKDDTECEEEGNGNS